MRTIARCIAGVALLFAAATFAADGPPNFKVSDLTFKRSDKWQWIETTSAMRAAQLKVTDEKTKETAEVVFYYFGAGGAGGKQANVERWFGQFSEPREKINAKVEDVQVNGTAVTYVSAEGTYQSGMPGGPKTPLADHALVGAIVDSKQGAVFARFVGPKELVKTTTADFKKLIESALKKD